MKKNPILIAWSILFGSIFSFIAVMTVGADFLDYQSIMEGNYESPWYNPNWFVQPYTNYRLSQYKPAYEISTNAAKNQIWIVKKIKVGDKEFWTVDYRYDLLGNVPLDLR